MEYHGLIIIFSKRVCTVAFITQKVMELLKSAKCESVTKQSDDLHMYIQPLAEEGD